MRAVVIGGQGQLARALVRNAPPGAIVTAPSHAECDLTDNRQLEHWFAQCQPQVVFNAAAYTAVDAAENNAEEAENVNARGVAQLAVAGARFGARIVHVSTDFVFDGTAGRPYKPDDMPNPLGVYGRTKLAGEIAALTARDALVVRTAWVYAEQGHNFVHTMLRLMTEREEIRVVADQIGTPTYAGNLAVALWSLAQHEACGIYHFTDAGVASWYDFAVAIQEEALAAKLLAKPTRIVPIATEGYPMPARRPAFCVLDKNATWSIVGQGQHWRIALRGMMGRILRG